MSGDTSSKEMTDESDTVTPSLRSHSYTPCTPAWMISFRCFALGVIGYILRLTSSILVRYRFTTDQYFDNVTSTFLLQLAMLVLVKCSVTQNRFSVAWRALLLGCLLNLGLTFATYTVAYQTIGIYLIFLSIFHWSEYMMQSIFNPETTQVDSYMLYHSNAYVIALITSLAEFALEFYVWPGLKLPNIITNLGITLVIFGEALRKASMWTAKSNFNHYVQFDKDEQHELVTHGVYSLFRHPSYVGWFWWSIGTQFILFNPFCAVAYSAASWKFFSDRIYTEEKTLLQFFGTQYMEYQQKVGTGLPFIQGYIIPTVAPPTLSSTPNKDD